MKFEKEIGLGVILGLVIWVILGMEKFAGVWEKEILKEREQSLEVEILTKDDEKVGMGVVSQDEKIMTANHVVLGNLGWKVKWEGENFWGEILERDEKKDLAELEVKGILGKTEFGDEEGILRIGESWGEILEEGVQFWNLEKVTSDLVKIGIQVKKGESGRGVWNEKNELVGIVIGFDEEGWGVFRKVEF